MCVLHIKPFFLPVDIQVRTTRYNINISSNRTSTLVSFAVSTICRRFITITRYASHIECETGIRKLGARKASRQSQVSRHHANSEWYTYTKRVTACRKCRPVLQSEQDSSSSSSSSSSTSIAQPHLSPARTHPSRPMCWTTSGNLGPGMQGTKTFPKSTPQVSPCPLSTHRRGSTGARRCRAT